MARMLPVMRVDLHLGNKEALELLETAIGKAGCTEQVLIGMDPLTRTTGKYSRSSQLVQVSWWLEMILLGPILNALTRL